MNKRLYSKLAFTNIGKNKTTFFPYMLSCTTIITLYYMLTSITAQTEGTNFYGASTMTSILQFGVGVAAVFSAVVIFYTNSFLMKRRKKELGLYGVLGMEKRHVRRVLFYEVFFVGALCLSVGLILGILFGKLMFLLLLNLVGVKSLLAYTVPLGSVLQTVGLFGLTFFAVMIFNSAQIQLANPITLFSSAQYGEREPKVKWLLTLIGVLTLGSGYVMALSVEDPIQSLFTFLIAVVLVIIGTYLLFTTGSIALMKALRKNKGYYYQKKHFISLSSMLYRMKKNAVGLANICILSAGILVVLSTTLSLFIGTEQIMRNRFPREGVATAILVEGENTGVKMEEALRKNAEKYGVKAENVLGYHQVGLFGTVEGNRIKDAGYSNVENGRDLLVITLEDYNRMFSQNKELAPGEVLLFGDTKGFEKELLLNELVFTPKELSSDVIIPLEYMSAYTPLQMIVSDMKTLDQIRAAISTGEHEQDISYVLSYDLVGDEEAKAQCFSSMRRAMNDVVDRVARTDNVNAAREDYLSLYGSLFFIGMFIGAMFLVTTVLIIYYKQVSEGYEDRERFAIMQKVGMSKKEVQSSIKSQILSVFFLPLLGAVIHIAVAFKLINNIMLVFGLHDTGLFFWCTVFTVLIFTAFYALVYSLTARTYYKIVK